jgi:hypothetical protein
MGVGMVEMIVMKEEMPMIEMMERRREADGKRTTYLVERRYVGESQKMTKSSMMPLIVNEVSLVSIRSLSEDCDDEVVNRNSSSVVVNGAKKAGRYNGGEVLCRDGLRRNVDEECGWEVAVGQMGGWRAGG